MSILNSADKSGLANLLMRYVDSDNAKAFSTYMENIAASIATNAEGVAATAAAAAIAANNPHLVYKALVTQAGTSNPTATVLGANTIGAIVWARTGAGVYTATLASPFTAGKTVVTIGSQAVSEGIFIDVVMTSTSVITFTVKLLSYSSGLVYTNTDAEITSLPVTIEVYP